MPVDYGLVPKQSKTTGRTLHDGGDVGRTDQRGRTVNILCMALLLYEVAGIWTGSLSAYQVYPGKSGGKANMCLAGMFSGGVWFPTALCAQMFWNCREPYNVIQEKVLLRKRIRF